MLQQSATEGLEDSWRSTEVDKLASMIQRQTGKNKPFLFGLLIYRLPVEGPTHIRVGLPISIILRNLSQGCPGMCLVTDSWLSQADNKG